MTLEILEQPTILEVVNGDTELTTVNQTTVLEYGQGPPGPQGDPGPPGPPGPPGAGATPIVGFPALRAIPTVSLVVNETGRIVVRTVSGVYSGSGWFLVAGTTADDGSSVIRPDDWASGTNEKIWVKIWGL